jgi:hypothetical protein
LYPTAWNEANQWYSNPPDQLSFLYQLYGPSPVSHNSHLVVWDGAQGSQTLSTWDPTVSGYYATNNCGGGPDPECNYKRIRRDLINAKGPDNTLPGYSELQVQAILIDTSDSFPLCSLTQPCSDSTGNAIDPSATPDAYQTEIYLGRILRYLKCSVGNPDLTSCRNGNPRYPNLRQVFITSRTYGLYANLNKAQSQGHWCLMPEPYAFEEGIGVQRTIVAQITSTPDEYSGRVDTVVAPWFDWGPYLWVNGPNPRSDLLVWCNGQGGNPCGITRDVRYGDPDPNYSSTYWGDFTHPTNHEEQMVAGQLVKWLQGTSGPGLGIQSYISDWVTWMK